METQIILIPLKTAKNQMKGMKNTREDLEKSLAAKRFEYPQPESLARNDPKCSR
jgi:hypothetical protein